ncbi:MAG: BatA domain-containing protein, partial [Planctomycetota bacterium]
MVFTSATILWFFTLCAIPIIIYILNRRKYKKIMWAAMEYLLQAMKKNRRRLRIENLLLLIIRTAIILILVLGMAGPLLKKGGLLEKFVRPKKNIVVLIDNSFSMAYKSGEKTLLDKAIRVATALIEKLESGDRIAVALMNSDLDTEGLFPTPVTITEKKDDIKNIIAAVKTLSVSHKTTNVLNTLEKLIKLLDKFEPD